MFYTVFSTNDNPYMQWQSELLEYSWKRVGQEGVLVRLVATERPDALPTHRHARCIATRPWDNHPESGDAYPVYNKPASLLEWVFRHRPEGTVLLLDPDCVFRKPVTRKVVPGAPASQSWIDLPGLTPSRDNPFGLPPMFGFLNDHCAKIDMRIEPVMIPTLIHTRDLRRICARWLQLCGVVRDHARDDMGNQIWESDMYAYVAACAEYDLQHEPISLGICTNWDPKDAPDAPIIHYCQKILARDGHTLFDKHRYEPWTRVDTTSQTLQPYGAELIEIIESHIDDRSGIKPRPKKSDRVRRGDGVMEGRLLDEMLLERPADGASLWINSSTVEIWDLCDGTRTVGDVAKHLRDVYEIEGDALDADVLQIVSQLSDIGFLRFN